MDFARMTGLLEQELIPALGCTEPIAIAFAAATARQQLGRFPDQLSVSCSGNIIKNAQGVVVPGTGDLRGLRAAAILGALAGRAGRGLEVLNEVREADVEQCRAYLAQGFCQEGLLDTEEKLQVLISATADDDTVEVELKRYHTNITRIAKNGAIIFSNEDIADDGSVGIDASSLSLEDIFTYSREVDLSRLSGLLERQLSCNLAVAEEGLAHEYGAAVGRTILEAYGDSDPGCLARAYAAAGSDARMSGCTLPVVINSGSGNQGLTVSLPVLMYSRALNCSQEQLYRALILANLISIYQKSMIGRLSAFCGAVSAACGAGAGITYLHGGDLEQISSTITNTLANVSGIVCDGAKPSCAAKIASAVDAAILGQRMAMAGRCFHSGEGLIKGGLEQTMRAIGRLASEGMRETDQEILRIMLEGC